MIGALPGQTVVSQDGKNRGVIEKGLGGGDFIVRWRDGTRVALNQREFELATSRPAAVPMTTKAEEPATEPTDSEDDGGDELVNSLEDPIDR